MAKMKYWNGTTWEILDAKDADTLDGKHYSDIKSEIQTVQNNFNTHQNNNVQHIKYATASGTNTYTTTISGITSLTEGLSIKIKFTNANTGASTLNINGLGAKSILKSNGNPLSSGNIKAGQICHLVYTGSVFQLLGEGGEYGTAQPQHVLEGYTIGTEEGIKEGTMPNHGAKTFTPSDSTQTSGAGYYSSITVNPRPTLSGNAGTSQVLSGYTFYSNNYTKQTGTMPNQGAKIITPSTVNQAIPAGYHNGLGYVKGDSNLIASNIKNGVTIFGVTGNYSGLADIYTTQSIASGEYANQTLFTITGGYMAYVFLPDITITGLDDYSPAAYNAMCITGRVNPFNTNSFVDVHVKVYDGNNNSWDLIISFNNRSRSFAIPPFVIIQHGNKIQMVYIEGKVYLNEGLSLKEKTYLFTSSAIGKISKIELYFESSVTLTGTSFDKALIVHKFG